MLRNRAPSNQEAQSLRIEFSVPGMSIPNVMHTASMLNPFLRTNLSDVKKVQNSGVMHSHTIKIQLV